MDAKTGEPQWRHMHGFYYDRSSPEFRTHVAKIFRFFPDAGRPLETDCKALCPSETLRGGAERSNLGFSEKVCLQPVLEAPVSRCRLRSFDPEREMVEKQKPPPVEGNPD